jgi:hypothetical protein
MNITLPKAMAAHVTVQGVEHQVAGDEDTVTRSFPLPQPAAAEGRSRSLSPCLLGRARSVNALVFLDGAQIVGPRFVREQPRP